MPININSKCKLTSSKICLTGMYIKKTKQIKQICMTNPKQDNWDVNQKMKNAINDKLKVAHNMYYYSRLLDDF